MPKPTQSYALIDIDNTLFPYFVMERMMQHLLKVGILGVNAYDQCLALLAAYKAGQIEYIKMGNAVMSLIAMSLGGQFQKTVTSTCLKFAYEEIRNTRPVFKGFVPAALNHNIKTILVTSEPQPMASAFARALGAHSAIGSEMSIDSKGRYAGEILTLIAPEDKGIAVRRALPAETSRIVMGFGDEITDLSILEPAKHAFAICPKPELRVIAKECGWTILDADATPGDLAFAFTS